jgi:hypothetical protein
MINKNFFVLSCLFAYSVASARPAVNQPTPAPLGSAVMQNQIAPAPSQVPVVPITQPVPVVPKNTAGKGLESSGSGTSMQQPNVPSVRDASKGSSGASGLTAAVSVVTGGVMMGMGAMKAAQCPKPKTACAEAAMYFMMGSQAMSQAAASKGQSNAAGMTMGQVDWNAGGAGSGGVSYDPDLKNAGLDPKKIEAIQKNLTSEKGLNGFKLSKDGKTLTTPDGKKMSTSVGSSAASLAKAGFDKNAIAAAMGLAAKTEKGVIEKIGSHTAAVGFNETAGAGSIKSGSSSTSGSGGGYGYGGINAANNPLRDPAASSVAGLTTEFNGEKIGVAQDQIFQMISRRYDHKMQREGEGFLPASVTAPR